jgi:CHASE3 domain sensor protein
MTDLPQVIPLKPAQVLVTRLAAGFGVLVAISVASVLLVNKARDDNGWVTHTVEAENQINALLLEIRRAESAARGFLLTQEPELLREHDAAVANVVPYATKLAQLVSDNPAQASNLKRLSAAIDIRLDQFVREMDLVKQNNLAAATALVSEAAAGRTSVTIRINPTEPAAALEKMLSESPVSSGLGDEMLRVWGIKMVADGGSDLAYLRKDYANRPGFRGQPGGTRENFITAARLCNKYGWRVGIHALGDAAIDMAGAAVRGVVFLELRPYLLRHPRPLLLELFFGGDHAAHLADRVLDARLRLVEEQCRVAVRNVAIVTTRADAGAVGEVPALAVFVRHPLHRMTGAAAELVGSGRGHHHLRADDCDSTDHYTEHQKCEHRPPCAGRRQPPPRSCQESAPR